METYAGFPEGSRIEGSRLVTGRRTGEAVLTAVYRDGKLSLKAETIVTVTPPPIPLYDGPTVITPKRQAQELETGGTWLDSDITVLAIPFASIGNSGGGHTAEIGRDE